MVGGSRDGGVSEGASEAREVKKLCKIWGREHYNWLKAKGAMEFGEDDVDNEIIKVEAGKIAADVAGRKKDAEGQNDKRKPGSSLKEGEHNAGPGRKGVRKVKRGTIRKESGAEEDKQHPDDKEFTAITKQSYRLLPRNLKSKSTLEDLNVFYKKLFTTAQQKPAGLNTVFTDDDVLRITGESSTDKADVLRGVGVLRRSDGGLCFAGQKKKNPPRIPVRSKTRK